MIVVMYEAHELKCGNSSHPSRLGALDESHPFLQEGHVVKLLLRLSLDPMLGRYKLLYVGALL